MNILGTGLACHQYGQASSFHNGDRDEAAVLAVPADSCPCPLSCRPCPSPYPDYTTTTTTKTNAHLS